MLDKNGFKVKKIAFGEKHSIIMTKSGKIYGVGDNEFYQLGHPYVCGDKDHPHRWSIYSIASLYPQRGCIGIPIDIKAGKYHNLVLMSNGVVVSFGKNKFGQLGSGCKFRGDGMPRSVHIYEQVKEIAAGPECSFFLTQRGKLYVSGSGFRLNYLNFGYNNLKEPPDEKDAIWGTKKVTFLPYISHIECHDDILLIQ